MAEVSITDRIIDLFDATCVMQFESMGCSVLKVENPSSWTGVLSAHIEAVSEDLSIQLLLIAPSPLLAQTMPVGDGYSVADPDLQKDWLNELANRFLGRLKNKLVSLGCILKIGLPIGGGAVSGEEEYIVGMKEDQIVRCFEIAGDIASDVLECRLYIKLHNEEVKFLELGDEDESWFREGYLEDL